MPATRHPWLDSPPALTTAPAWWQWALIITALTATLLGALTLGDHFAARHAHEQQLRDACAALAAPEYVADCLREVSR